MLKRVAMVTAACIFFLMLLGCRTDPAGTRNILKIEGTGTTYAARGIAGKIAGRDYLFVIMNSEGSEPGIPAGILMLDIRNPVKPIRVAYLRAPDNARFLSGVELSDTTLLVSASDFLWLIDVSSPSEPRELSKLSTVRAINTAMLGNFAYVNDMNEKITIVNLSNPAQPEVAGELALPSASQIRLTISDSLLFAIVERKLNMIDISSPDSLKILGTFERSYISNIEVEGRYGYLAFNGYDGCGMSVLDL
jgi:hypothetical protein